MSTRRVLATAAVLFSSLTIGGTTAGLAIAASSPSHSVTNNSTQPAQGTTIQLDRWFCPTTNPACRS